MPNAANGTSISCESVQPLFAQLTDDGWGLGMGFLFPHPQKIYQISAMK